MGLENLDSIFNENLPQLAEDYQRNQPLNTGQSNLVSDISTPTTTPILDQFSRLPSSFIGVPSSFNYTPASDLPAFRMQTFDPRVPKNNRIQINSKNTYAGTIHTPELVTDYSTAGKFDNLFTPQSEKENDLIGTEAYRTSDNDLGGLGIDLRASQGYFSLYNNDHTPKDDGSSFNGFSPYTYGGNVSREGLNIKNPRATGIFSGLSKNYRNSTFGLADSEPYIVSPIGDVGRELNKGNRSVPFFRSSVDTQRITSFLSSPAGIAFTLRQNLTSVIPTSVVRASVGQDLEDLPAYRLTGPFSDFANYHGDSLRIVPQRFNRGYNFLSTLASVSPIARSLGIGAPSTLTRSGLPEVTLTGTSDTVSSEYGRVNNPYYGMNTVPFLFEDSIRGGNTTPGYGGLGGNGDSLIRFQSRLVGAATRSPELNNIPKPYLGGDKFTLAQKISGFQLKASTYRTKTVDIDGEDSSGGVASGLEFNIEGEKQGMPLYFKDLRSDQYLFFRAYVSGITENVSPSWAQTNYIGRSEPVWVYERGERDLSFILKIFAHTKDELQMIYNKLNHLTSLCYPQYMQDVGMSGYGAGAEKQYRMKPPLVKFRMGELYGDINKEQLTWIKSLTYTIPDEGVWETVAGARVPKYVTAAISLQVIHESNQEGRFSPGYGTKFYGYNGQFKPNSERWSRKQRNNLRATDARLGDRKASLVSRDVEDY